MAASLKVLEFQGLDKSITGLVKRFYDKIVVYFGNKHTVSPDAIHRTNGLLQGCPLSMVMLAATMAVYRRKLKKEVPLTELGIFVDDRLLWSTGAQAVATVQKAIEVTKTFDAVCGRVWNIGKGITFATNEEERESAKEVLKDAGVLVDEFAYLGTEYDTRGAKRIWKVKSKRMDKMECRLKRIARCSNSHEMRRKLVEAMVIPCAKWGGQWRANSGLKKLACDIERVLLSGKIWRGRSPALTWILALSHRVHPEYQQDMTAIQARMRTLRKNMLNGTQRVAKGRFEEVCRKWRWNVVSEKVVDTPQGTMDLTRVGRKALEKHAVKGWEHHMMMQDNRAYHDKDRSWEPVLSAHAAYYRGQPTFLGRSIALGCAPDWRNVDHGVAAHCMCGEANPTRRHWMWSCSAIAAERQPTTNIQEALGIEFIKRPTKHLERDLGDATSTANMRAALREAVNEPVLVASDGSAIDDHTAAGWGIAISVDGEARTEKGMVVGADQSSYAAELQGLAKIIRVNANIKKKLWVLVDNKAVVDGFTEIQSTLAKEKGYWLPRGHAGSWNDIRKGLKTGQEVKVEWIPSHGKRTGEWKTESGYDEGVCREINDKADKYAGEAAKEQKLRYMFEAYFDRSIKKQVEITRVLERLHALVLEYAGIQQGLVHPSALVEKKYFM